MVVTFDLFGTLVDVERSGDPAAAVAAELSRRGVAVPDDWERAYAEPHVDAPDGSETPLPAHVRAALESRGRTPEDEEHEAVRQSVLAAFDPTVETRTGASAVVDAAADRGPVGVLSNCSVSGLVHRTIARSTLDPDAFDAVVTSVGCGWRKPDRRAFEAVADALDVPVAELRHVGDDPVTDGGVEEVGGTAILLADRTLEDVAIALREGRWE